MVDFLKYYALDVIVINGLKYQIPALEAENGLRWNIISITSIAKVFIKVKRSLEKLKADIVRLNEEVSTMSFGKVSPVEYNEKLMKQKDKITVKIAEETKDLRIYSDKHDYAKNDNEKERLKVRVNNIKENIKKLQQERDTTVSKILDEGVIKKYRKIDVEIQQAQRQIRAEEKVLSQNLGTFKVLCQ